MRNRSGKWLLTRLIAASNPSRTDGALVGRGPRATAWAASAPDRDRSRTGRSSRQTPGRTPHRPRDCRSSALRTCRPRAPARTAASRARPPAGPAPAEAVARDPERPVVRLQLRFNRGRERLPHLGDRVDETLVKPRPDSGRREVVAQPPPPDRLRRTTPRHLRVAQSRPAARTTSPASMKMAPICSLMMRVRAQESTLHTAADRGRAVPRPTQTGNTHRLKTCATRDSEGLPVPKSRRLLSPRSQDGEAEKASSE